MSETPATTPLEILAAQMAAWRDEHAQEVADLRAANDRLRNDVTALRSAMAAAREVRAAAPVEPRTARDGRPSPLGRRVGRAAGDGPSTSRRGLLRLGGVAAAGVAAAAANAATGTRDAHAIGVGWATGTVNADNQTYVQPSNGSFSDPALLAVQLNTGSAYLGLSAANSAAIAAYDTTSGFGATAVYATTGGGNGVYGIANAGTGVYGSTNSGLGVYGTADTGIAVEALAFSGNAVYAANGSFGVANPGGRPARHPVPNSSGPGAATIYAATDIGAAVDAHSSVGSVASAVQATGTNNSPGLTATSDTNNGVVAHSASGTGLSASSGTGSAVVASSSGVGYGLYLTAPSGWAIGCVGRIRVIGNSAGTATILAGHTAITVPTTACSAVSLVIVTPLADPGARVWTTRAAGVFTIHVSSAPAANLDFTYLLLN